MMSRAPAMAPPVRMARVVARGFTRSSSWCGAAEEPGGRRSFSTTRSPTRNRLTSSSPITSFPSRPRPTASRPSASEPTAGSRSPAIRSPRRPPPRRPPRALRSRPPELPEDLRLRHLRMTPPFSRRDPPRSVEHAPGPRRRHRAVLEDDLAVDDRPANTPSAYWCGLSNVAVSRTRAGIEDRDVGLHPGPQQRRGRRGRCAPPGTTSSCAPRPRASSTFLSRT